MENWLQRIFLAALLGSLAVAVQAQSSSAERSVLDKIITPDMERRQITRPDIDTEDFEVGVYYGIMSVEDFGSNGVAGLRLAYHVSEDFFVEAGYGQTTTEETSFELLSGSTRILTDAQRELSYYNISVGYNVLPGEIFIGRERAFTSAVYLIAGVGNTDFADDEHFTYNAGVGLRLLANDWLALHLDFRSHMFEHDLLGEEKTVLNLEAYTGVTFFF
ncbi:outer membrane beta-barrel domain-containing protein [Pseudomaricurvus alcaniphilus]|uniref:outer membrane beta-barrel domain-containing protein n=1 Tax=Pseudomaricurvus alcaniphilus TaxID=1166482 RepID=UPI00140D311B|nr:outer membrane beta-barrel domain-containing protein [Pseudomaricurvus alcaniphilus]NHN37777.1 outer membrane beta-barrel domain-containing protein [Pseudomaricurvus alcaniphilus]